MPELKGLQVGRSCSGLPVGDKSAHGSLSTEQVSSEEVACACALASDVVALAALHWSWSGYSLSCRFGIHIHQCWNRPTMTLLLSSSTLLVRPSMYAEASTIRIAHKDIASASLEMFKCLPFSGHDPM